jgi:hypothetical protein
VAVSHRAYMRDDFGSKSENGNAVRFGILAGKCCWLAKCEVCLDMRIPSIDEFRLTEYSEMHSPHSLIGLLDSCSICISYIYNAFFLLFSFFHIFNRLNLQVG